MESRGKKPVVGSQPKNDKSKLRAKVWNVYIRLNSDQAKCSLCQKVKRGGTTNFKKHIFNKHRAVYNDLFKNEDKWNITARALKEKYSNVTSNKNITKLILNMSIEDLLPLTFVNGEGFRNLMEYIAPDFTIPTVESSSSLLERHFKDVRSKMSLELENTSCISLTTSSISFGIGIFYTAVTAHYLLNDSWDMKSSLLGIIRGDCCEKDKIINLTNEWKITDKVFGCVSKTGTKFHDNWENIPCVMETLNTILQTIVKEIQPLMDKIKNLIVFIQQNELPSVDNFETEYFLQKSTVTDQLTNLIKIISKFSSLQSSIEEAVNASTKPIQSLTNMEWKFLPELIEILMPLQRFSEEICSNQDVSTSKVLAGVEIVNHFFKTLQNSLTQNLSKKLLDKVNLDFYKNFHGNCLHDVILKSAFLDPRFKKLCFSDSDLFERAKQLIKSDLDKNKPPAIKKEPMEVDTQSNTENSFWTYFDSKVSDDFQPIDTSAIEVQNYLEENNLHRSEDPLKWWQSKALTYPQLAALARKYLSVMGTTVPSEKILLKGREIMGEKCDAFTYKQLEQVLFLHYNKESRGTMEIEDLLDMDEEIIEETIDEKFL